ncbi:hypothetical protein RRG08_008851 [Elysia crispata]|uniref:Uncharacterized protein n=1 Tax=Elysia crispata TaxID=231223 RepID=A0AAE1A8Y6_9GAST|nr:hypothetical protein RRG08_008851 [Elysia crispata]
MLCLTNALYHCQPNDASLGPVAVCGHRSFTIDAHLMDFPYWTPTSTFSAHVRLLGGPSHPALLHPVGDIPSVDLTKLRLSDSSGSAESGAYTDPLISPDLDDYTMVGAVHGGEGAGGGAALLGGFCCASFPLARGIARTIKRL